MRANAVNHECQQQKDQPTLEISILAGFGCGY
jgi:hypothetical protein